MIRPSIVLAAVLVASSSMAMAKSPNTPKLPSQFIGHFCVVHTDDEDASPEHDISSFKRIPMSVRCPHYEDDLEIMPTGMILHAAMACTFLNLEALTHQGYRIRSRCRQDGYGIIVRNWFLYPDENTNSRRPFKGITLDADDDDDTPATTGTSRPAVPAPDPGEPDLGLWKRLAK